MHEKPKESDWKAFRKLVPEIRERYLQARIEEFSSVLHNEELNATEKFWELEKRASETSKILRTCLDGHSRSKMELFIGVMFRHDLMTKDDLSVFSSELREQMLRRISL